MQCKSSDGNIVNDNYCSGTKPTTSQSCNTHVCGTTPLYVTHTANGNIITLKWNVIQGPERLDIHVFNESQEKRVRAGDAKMADKRFDYTVSWWGKHLFKLIPSDGSQETLYEVYIYSIQTSRYPGCNTDDIKIGNHTIAACNVGSSKAGISSTSYGEDYTYNEAKNICANGYHLPSKEERWAIIDIWNASSNHVGDYIILPYSFITEEGIFIPAGAPFIADRSNGDLLKFQNDHRLPLD